MGHADLLEGFGLRFHHVGLASKRPDLSLALLLKLGYAVGSRTCDEEQNVNLVLCTHDSMPDLEVVFPTDTPGPLDVILAGGDESFYHLCFETSDLDATLAALKAAGHRVVCVSPPKPAILFGDRHVSFYRIKGFGLIELLEP